MPKHIVPTPDPKDLEVRASEVPPQQYDPEIPPAHIKAGMVDQKTRDLWNESKSGHTFIGITRLDNGMMFARPCFHKIGDKLYDYEAGKEIPPDDIKQYGENYVVIDVTQVSLTGQLNAHITSKEGIISRLAAIKPEAPNYAEAQKTLIKERKELQKCQDTVQALNKQNANKGEIEQLIKEIIKDPVLSRAAINGVGHKALVVKVASQENKLTDSSRKLKNMKALNPERAGNVIGWALMGNIEELKSSSHIVRFASTLNIIPFRDGLEQKKEIWHGLASRNLPPEFAQYTLNALNMALVIDNPDAPITGTGIGGSKILLKPYKRYKPYKLYADDPKKIQKEWNKSVKRVHFELALPPEAEASQSSVSSSILLGIPASPSPVSLVPKQFPRVPLPPPPTPPPSISLSPPPGAHSRAPLPRASVSRPPIPSVLPVPPLLQSSSSTGLSSIPAISGRPPLPPTQEQKIPSVFSAGINKQEAQRQRLIQQQEARKARIRAEMEAHGTSRTLSSSAPPPPSPSSSRGGRGGRPS